VVSSAAEKSSFGETKVLVIDDEHRVRKVIQGLLLGLNCTKIHEARNGAEALEQIVVLAPDVVLLDWTLPDMSGPEFLRRLHSSLSAPVATAPVIMLVEQDQRA
jgi:CheY-like chemotaxis protein